MGDASVVDLATVASGTTISEPIQPAVETPSLPWYWEFNDKLKQTLRLRMEQVPITKPESFDSVDDFFAQARNAVHRPWVESMSGLYDVLQIHTTGHVQDQITEIINNKGKFTDTITKEDYWRLEDLRNHGEEEIWSASVLALSSQNQEIITLAKEWLNEMSEDECHKLGFEKKALQLYLEINSLIQNDVDTTYVSQLEATQNMKGGYNNPYAEEEDGSNYVFFENTDDGLKRMSLAEKFPSLQRVAQTLEGQSVKIEFEISQGTLPLEYTDLGVYLHTLASAITDSNVNNLKELSEKWNNVEVAGRLLDKSTCPIIVEEPNFYEDGLVQISFLVGLREKESESRNRYAEAFIRSWREIITEYGLPQTDLNITFIKDYFANGEDHTWVPSGYAGRGITVILNEAGTETVKSFNKYGEIVKDLDINTEALGKIVGLLAHECGHKPLADDLTDIKKRFGDNLALHIMEETRADVVGALILKQSGVLNDPNIAKAYLTSYLIDYIEYIATHHEGVDHSNTWYAFSGSTIVTELFKCGAIAWNGNQIEIKDALRGVDAMAKLGHEVLKIYSSKDSGGKDLDNFISTHKSEFTASEEFQKYKELAGNLVNKD